ncbi:ester cyclase [Microbispora sp. RL4-1S]|uniref:Ester cyclase n=1 Tax=Microbispora oryzae TaxID=2806554 RepID=A0A941AHD6_9ACTN|nr:ester cyclase [Microbispora oryzae]MBP2703975.1 ester cyclase [Microbispora oryzae]
MPDVVYRLINAINAHDLESCLGCYHTDALMVGPELQAEGLEQIAAYHAHVWEGLPDIRVNFWERISSGDRVMIEGCSCATHTGPFLIAGGEVVAPTGRAVNFRECWVFTLEHDLIVSHRLYHDQMELYSQLGVGLTIKVAEPPIA